MRETLWEPYSPDRKADLHRLLATTAEVLASAQTWTKGTQARNATGDPVFPDDPDATCWCLTGAFRRARVLTGVGWGPVWKAEAMVSELRGIVAIGYNDTLETTIDDIRLLLQEMLDKTAPTA